MSSRPGLEIACRGKLLLRRESVRFQGARKGARRLLFASDLHLSGPWTERPAVQLAELAEAERPDAVLLGGDLADSRSGLPRLEALVRRLGRTAPVLAVSGNHDSIPGVRRVQEAVQQGGGLWLRGRPVSLPGISANGEVRAEGARTAVLCAHDPSVWPAARAAGYPVVLAGHLHGLQWVLFCRGGRMYPGAWLWRWNGPRFDAPDSTLLVSSGVSDTFPLRWRCPREALLCELS